MKNNIGRGRRGFTMLEVLVSFGIVIVIGAVSVMNLYGWREQKQLGATSQKVATILREAESRALSQDQGSAWGIHFENSASGPFVAIFKGDVYEPGAEVERISLPASLDFDETDLPAGSSRDVVFTQITGKPTIRESYDFAAALTCAAEFPEGSGIRACVPRTTSLTARVTAATMRLRSKPSEQSKVFVDASGSIAFDSINCVIACVQNVVVLDPPVAASLSAAPTSTTPSQQITLTWSSVNADSCSSSWGGLVAVSGTQIINPAQTTTYTLTCDGRGGTAVQDVVVTVTPVGGGRGGGRMDVPQ